MFWQLFALNECNLFLEEQVDVLSERRTGAPCPGQVIPVIALSGPQYGVAVSPGVKTEVVFSRCCILIIFNQTLNVSCLVPLVKRLSRVPSRGISASYGH